MNTDSKSGKTISEKALRDSRPLRMMEKEYPGYNMPPAQVREIEKDLVRNKKNARDEQPAGRTRKPGK